jgi:signal transduction histidine kinase
VDAQSGSPTHRLLAAVPWPQALAEALLLTTPLYLLLLSVRNALRLDGFGQGLLFLVPAAALWCALRARSTRGAWWRRAAVEGVYTVGVVIAIAGGWSGLAQLLGAEDALDGTVLYLAPVMFYLFASGFFYVGFRVVLAFWRFWSGLRRRRLVWALTHTQLQVAFFIILLGAMAAALPVVLPQSDNAAEAIIYTLLPYAGVVVAFGTALLLFLVPPTLLVGYLAARRTTKRLEELARGTAALRRGDYGVRVEVRGEDEVAQLQGDFNAMAFELEGAIRGLEEERDKVSELLASRRELLAAVSHELRTPLATIRAHLEPMLVSEMGQDDSGSLTVMEGEIGRLQRLIDDLLTLSRSEAGGLSLNLGSVDVASVVREQVAAYAPVAWGRGKVEVVADLPEDPGLAEPMLAMADPERLAQILSNLMRNGVRHTPPGGIVSVSAEVEGEWARIEVRDTGEGIPEHELARIWERFYRGDSARQKDHRGAGLGLALVKELAEAMGGEVDVRRDLGQGSCFVVRLPLA